MKKTTSKTRRPQILQKKIHVRQTSGCHWEIADTNPGRKCVGHVSEAGSGKYHARVDYGNGEDGNSTFLLNVHCGSPLAAYELCIAFGQKVDR